MCLRHYIFKVTNYIERQPYPIVGEKRSLSVFNSNTNSDVMLWHYHLRHPNFMISKNSFHYYSLKIQIIFSVKFVNYPSIFANPIQFNHTNHLIIFP